MKFTFETESPKEAAAILSTFSNPLTKPVARVYRVGVRHRQKCILCGKGFLAKRRSSKYCGRPCQSHYVGTPKGDRLAGKAQLGAVRKTQLAAVRKAQPRKKRLLTRAQLAAVRKNVAKARAALAAKVRARRKAERKGVTLIPGDPLSSSPQATV